MKRLFLAIPIEKEIVEKIEAYTEQYKDMPIFKSAKWVDKKHYHLTVLFLGDVSDRLLPEMQNFIRGVCSQVPRFNIDLERITFFPPKEESRMIWLRFKKSLQFEELSKELFKYLYEVDFKLKKDDNSPIPHLTLARLHDPVKPKAIRWSQLEIPTIKANVCHLYESTQTPDGAVYTLIEEYKFAD
ncbi:MAG: RNA 2',3'-cyclic phosphodiesterase [Candidatus Gracilibacteria bacterium]